VGANREYPLGIGWSVVTSPTSIAGVDGCCTVGNSGLRHLHFEADPRFVQCDTGGSPPRPTLIVTSAPTRRASASGSSRTPAWRWRSGLVCRTKALPSLGHEV
jgi:hypothetical protein